LCIELWVTKSQAGHRKWKPEKLHCNIWKKFCQKTEMKLFMYITQLHRYKSEAETLSSESKPRGQQLCQRKINPHRICFVSLACHDMFASLVFGWLLAAAAAAAAAAAIQRALQKHRAPMAL